MVSLKLFSWIDQRLREIFPRRQDEVFGGMRVLIIGDFFQLPPVMAKPLSAGMESAGALGYRRCELLRRV